MQPNIIILSGKGQYVECIYNGLNDDYPISTVVLENDPDEAITLKRRRKKIGAAKVAGQQLFAKYIIPKLKKSSKARVRELIGQSGLNFSKLPLDKIIEVHSVNDQAAIDLICNANPDVIIVNSTRLLSKTFLRSVQCPILNIHGGITPAYRGLAGAYWALAKGQPEKCGSTIHLIDEGVDTGAILAQDTIEIGPLDTYLTYAFLQLPKEIQMLKNILTAGVENALHVVAEGPSKIWYEPTIWEYWYYYITKKVK